MVSELLAQNRRGIQHLVRPAACDISQDVLLGQDVEITFRRQTTNLNPILVYYELVSGYFLANTCVYSACA